MRKGQLIRKILKDYKAHINFIKENYLTDFGSALHYVGVNNIDFGICYYSAYSLGQHRGGYDAKWVEKYYTHGRAWGRYPLDCYSVEEILKSLQLRVDNLEKELASGDKLYQKTTSKNYTSG